MIKHFYRVVSTFNHTLVAFSLLHFLLLQFRFFFQFACVCVREYAFLAHNAHWHTSLPSWSMCAHRTRWRSAYGVWSVQCARCKHNSMYPDRAMHHHSPHGRVNHGWLAEVASLEQLRDDEHNHINAARSSDDNYDNCNNSHCLVFTLAHKWH